MGDPGESREGESRDRRANPVTDGESRDGESRDRRDVHFADPRVRGDVPPVPSRARDEVPPKKIPFFKPGKELRELVERI